MSLTENGCGVSCFERVYEGMRARMYVSNISEQYNTFGDNIIPLRDVTDVSYFSCVCRNQTLRAHMLDFFARQHEVTPAQARVAFCSER